MFPNEKNSVFFFLFFKMSDMLASGKWQKGLLKRVLYGIVV